MVAPRRAVARVPGHFARRLHYRPGAQSRHRTLHPSSVAWRDVIRAYPWRRGAHPLLRLAYPVDPAHWQGLLRRAQSLRRFLHLHESRARHLLDAHPHQLPSGDLALQADGIARQRASRSTHATASPPPAPAPRLASVPYNLREGAQGIRDWVLLTRRCECTTFCVVLLLSGG